MHVQRVLSLSFICMAALLWAAPGLVAFTGPEVMDKVAERLAAIDLRAVLRIETVKRGVQAKERVLWIIVRPDEAKRSVFLEFTEPQENAGLRFLFQGDRQGEFRGYMYVPEEGAVVPLKGHDRSVDIGGTGMSLSDLLFFDRNANREEKLVREEDLDGRSCYVVEVKGTDQGTRLYWVRKDDFTLIRSRQLDAGGKLERELTVARFFQSADGRVYPRELHVTLPSKGLKTTAVLEHAVFGITIPEELLDPKTFGTASWRQ